MFFVVIIVNTTTLIYRSVNLDTTTALYGYSMINLNQTNIANETCTLVGTYGHLEWHWAGGSPDFQLNFQHYLLLCLICFVAYGREMWSIPFAWAITLLISKIILWESNTELASFWCMLSVISVAFIVLATMYDVYTQPRRRKNRINS